MRNISFALTTEQVRNRTKTVTRRIGWQHLTPGTLLQGVVKCQGLKKGERIQPISVIRVVGVRRESLLAMWRNKEYGREECRREGFPDGELSNPETFVGWFAASHKCCVDDEVTRIEFEYVEDSVA